MSTCAASSYLVLLRKLRRIHAHLDRLPLGFPCSRSSRSSTQSRGLQALAHAAVELAHEVEVQAQKQGFKLKALLSFFSAIKV